MNSLDFIRIHFFMVLTREKGTYACTREKGKAGGAKGKRERPAAIKGKRERAPPTISLKSH